MLVAIAFSGPRVLAHPPNSTQFCVQGGGGGGWAYTRVSQSVILTSKIKKVIEY